MTSRSSRWRARRTLRLDEGARVRRLVDEVAQLLHVVEPLLLEQVEVLLRRLVPRVHQHDLGRLDHLRRQLVTLSEQDHRAIIVVNWPGGSRERGLRLTSPPKKNCLHFVFTFEVALGAPLTLQTLAHPGPLRRSAVSRSLVLLKMCNRPHDLNSATS